MNDVLEGLLYLLGLAVSFVVTLAVVLVALWLGSKLKWRR